MKKFVTYAVIYIICSLLFVAAAHAAVPFEFNDSFSGFTKTCTVQELDGVRYCNGGTGSGGVDFTYLHRNSIPTDATLNLLNFNEQQLIILFCVVIFLQGIQTVIAIYRK